MDTEHPAGWFVLLMHAISWPAVLLMRSHNVADFSVGLCLGVLTLWWWLGIVRHFKKRHNVADEIYPQAPPGAHHTPDYAENDA